MPTYATWNPADKHDGLVLSNENKTVTTVVATDINRNARTTFPLSGKVYFEINVNNKSTYSFFGIANTSASLSTQPGGDVNSWCVSTHGYKYHNNVYTSISAICETNDVLQIAVDIPNQKWWYGINNSWAAGGDPANGINPLHDNLTGTLYVIIGILTRNGVYTINAGATAFTYTPPTGFSAYSYTSYKINGIVKANGIPYPGAKVIAIDRTNGSIVGSDIAAETTAEYEITGLVSGDTGRYGIHIIDPTNTYADAVSLPVTAVEET